MVINSCGVITPSNVESTMTSTSDCASTFDRVAALLIFSAKFCILRIDSKISNEESSSQCPSSVQKRGDFVIDDPLHHRPSRKEISTRSPFRARYICPEKRCIDALSRTFTCRCCFTQKQQGWCIIESMSRDALIVS